MTPWDALSDVSKEHDVMSATMIMSRWLCIPLFKARLAVSADTDRPSVTKVTHVKITLRWDIR